MSWQASILNWRAARALGYRKARLGDEATVGADGKAVDGSRVVTPAMAGEDEEGLEGGMGMGIEVCFADETRMSLGKGKVEIPARRLAIADLPVFAYAV